MKRDFPRYDRHLVRQFQIFVTSSFVVPYSRVERIMYLKIIVCPTHALPPTRTYILCLSRGVGESNGDCRRRSIDTQSSVRSRHFLSSSLSSNEYSGRTYRFETQCRFPETRANRAPGRLHSTADICYHIVISSYDVTVLATHRRRQNERRYVPEHTQWPRLEFSGLGQSRARRNAPPPVRSHAIGKPTCRTPRCLDHCPPPKFSGVFYTP